MNNLIEVDNYKGLSGNIKEESEKEGFAVCSCDCAPCGSPQCSCPPVDCVSCRANNSLSEKVIWDS